MKIIDNLNTLLGDDLKASLQPGARLKIAASCFSIYAYEALRDELSRIDALDFIFTAPTFVPNEATDRLRKEHREFFIPKARRESSLYGSEFEIQLRNRLTQRAIARECADWIRGKARFRSNLGKGAMQSFACVQTNGESVAYTPLQGFTAVDLGYQKGDALSNLVHRMEEPHFAETYLNLFNQLWEDPAKLEDVTETLCEHIASVYRENSPERVYFLILYHVFSAFLADIDEDVLPNERTGYQDSLVWNKLFNFQRDAAVAIINKLESYNGCILADSVGLGKTFTALAVVKYYELRNRNVLVLCPKKLADNWLNYTGNLTTNLFARDQFRYDVLCHTDLLRNSGESFGLPLNRVNWGNYDLVVIDESHNFRNNEAFKERETRYQRLMNRVIREGVKTKVLMLSATPVNNRFTDLRNQLALAYEGDAENLNRKLHTERDVEEIFRRAQSAFNQWSRLPPEERTPQSILDRLDFDFFELLDSVTIARSRKHIQTFYDTRDIGPFPARLPPLSFRCPVSNRADVLDLNGIYTRLSQFTLSIYAPVNHLFPSRIAKYEARYDTLVEGGKGTLKQKDRENALRKLMTTNLLKRLESSVEAFRLTLQSLETGHRKTLALIEDYKKSGRPVSIADLSADMEDFDPEDDDIPLPDDFQTGGKVQISLADMDVPSWERELTGDLALIGELLASMRLVRPEDDAKLQHLKAFILEKLEKPINPGNRKILLFSAFADTANYLYDQLAPFLLESKGLHTGRVTGKDSPKSTLGKGHDFQSLLTLFAPRAKEKHLVLPKEPREIDLLIGTDCISEGQNLQDCDCVVNYDIHWNPVRIIQRFGRIDRIGSPNASIQLVNYWPDISLDEYIRLKERVENRMMIADVAGTGDDNVLTAQSSEMAYRKEQLRRLQEEVIELEDVKTGVSITDLGLNEFRMDLLNYVKAHGEPADTPLGMHAVVPAQPGLGLKPGVIFALRNRSESMSLGRQNRLHPHYLVYIAQDGEIVADHTEVKKLLSLVRTSCKGQPQPIAAVCRLFNQLSDEGRNMSACSDLLSAAIRSMIDVKEETDLDSLFSGGRTTALVDAFAGLDDFELIAFLVVQEEE